MPQTLFEKIWNRHVIVQRGENEALLHVDRNFVHEGSFHAFKALALDGRKVRKPRQTFATADHYVPTRNREQGLAAVTDPEMRHMLDLFEKNTQSQRHRELFRSRASAAGHRPRRRPRARHHATRAHHLPAATRTPRRTAHSALTRSASAHRN